MSSDGGREAPLIPSSSGSVSSRWGSSWPSSSGSAGTAAAVGSPVANGLDWLIGAARIVLPLALVGVGALMVGRSGLVDFRPFRVGLVVASAGLLILLGANNGGELGGALDGGFERLVGTSGTIILGSFAFTVGIVLLTGASLGALLRRSANAAKAAHARAAEARRSIPRPAPVPVAEPSYESVPLAPPVDGAVEYPDVVSDAPPALAGARRPAHRRARMERRADQRDRSAFPLRAARDRARRVRPPGSQPPAPLARDREAAAAGARAHRRDARPGARPPRRRGDRHRQVSGPRVTRYEIQLAPGTKVGKVTALKDDLAYALATTEIRILAPIPGKQAVGVEVPNLAPNIVTLGDIFDTLPANASPVSTWLGKDISGAAVWADLARMPHILIAGTTGSGKSGCINTMLCSILLRSTPDEVRMILVDPKRVELGLYESIPHLLTPVVSSPKAAAAVLANVLTEMERRYERMSVATSRTLPELNKVLTGRGEAPLPYLLVVIDELADLMMVSPQEVEDAVIRLAQKSRAVGIHLVLATQRPSVDVITGMIKANVPSRIAFAVSSQTDSRVILDTAGAESLLGQGDMLFKPLGTSRLQRVQGAYVSEEEIALVVEACRGQREQELDESLLEAPGVEVVMDGDDGDFDPDEDPLLDKRDRDRRADADRVGLAAPAAPARRLHARGPPHRHARAPGDHLRLRRLEAAPRARRRARARGRARGRALATPPPDRPGILRACGCSIAGIHGWSETRGGWA